jgi:hypothetical protein
LLIVLWLAWPQPAAARRFFRARFRPGTLEIQKVGELELEAELGGIYGDGDDGSRAPVPDFTLSVGLLRWLELDLDGSFAVTKLGRPDREWVGEPLWVAARADLYNFKDEQTGSSFGIGVQAGPRLPSVHNARGIGVGALALIGGGTKTLHAVLNLGSTVDAAQSASINFGVAVEYELALRHKWSLQGELAGAHYFGAETDPNQLLLLIGFGAELREGCELSLLALTGPVFEGDRLGLLAGFKYDHELW